MLNAANYKAKNKPLKQPVVDASIEMFPADGSEGTSVRQNGDFILKRTRFATSSPMMSLILALKRDRSH